jgi:hypothetical protein
MPLSNQHGNDLELNEMLHVIRASSEISFPAVMPSVARPCRGAARRGSSMVDLLEVVLEPRNGPAEHFSEARRIM